MTYTQRTILVGLSKCKEGEGILLDRRFKRPAAQLLKAGWVEWIENPEGKRVYTINTTGRMALRSIEKQEKNQVKRKQLETENAAN